MSDRFWTIVFAIGAAQGMFLCAVLLFRHASNRLATRLLAAILGVFTSMILAGVLAQTLAEPLRHLVMFLNINTELAVGPLFLLFACSLLNPDRILTRRDALHFLPLALGMIAWGFAWVVLGEDERRLDFFDHHPAVPLYVLFKASWLFSYAVAIFRTLRSDPGVSRIEAPGRRPVELSWFRRWLVVLAGMAGLIYLTYFAERFELELPFESDPFASLMLAVTIYLASLMVLQRPWVLALRQRPAAANQWAGEAAQLTAYLEQKRPWLEPELGLGDLARDLGSTDNRLSTVIHEGLDTSFYALLNRYRLAEFERLTREPGLRHRSVLDLAFEAGFNSKASFYRVFRETHGTTPTSFRDTL